MTQRSDDVVIIDSGGANLASMVYALERLGSKACVSSDVECILNARRLILPGVGAAAAAMGRLRQRGLDRVLPTVRAPLLGVCLGMQLLFEHSAEGDVSCLGILPGQVLPIAARPNLPVPHMGWNTTRLHGTSALFDGIPDQSYFYFVHGFAVPAGALAIASVDYGGQWSAAVAQGNFYGVQFHPERSAGSGSRLLRNFLDLSCS